MSTKISELGQFAFIDRITKQIKTNNKSSKLGIGDDAAVLSNDSDVDTLISTDLMLEGIHFDLAYTPLKHLGYKSVVVAISDIYAMGGIPTQLLVSIGVTSRFSVEDIEELYSGIILASERYKVDIISGDTSASVTGLLINMTAVGVVSKGKEILRSTAQPTDLICLTGNIGAAYMGLQLLERERNVFLGQDSENIDPDFLGKEYIIERQLKPEIPLDTLNEIYAMNIEPTSMIDISDGLSSELLQIAKSSNVGIRIYEDRLPIDYQTASMAEEMNLNVSTVALNGGEDFEMLFTVPLGMFDKIKDIDNVRVIGHVTDSSLGVAMIARDGSEIELKAQGFSSQPSKN